MSAVVKLHPKYEGYRAMTPETLPAYLAGFKGMKNLLGGESKDWQVKEVGDGNLNLVFLVHGPAGGICVKQALPYVRLVGESWPLPLSRAFFEYEALVEQTAAAAAYVPKLHFHDEALALTAMELLEPHIIMRKGLIRGITYPHVARHVGEFLAHTLFKTSDFHMNAAEKKHKVALFAANTAMCKITEDLVFSEPYFDAPMNRWNAPHLDEVVRALHSDTALKIAAQELKHRFLTHAEAMIHGDLHTGSIMVTEKETKIIDPEFAFFGPMGFDVGAYFANLALSYFSQAGHAEKPGARDAYKEWLLMQIGATWKVFEDEFTALWNAREGGDSFDKRTLHSKEEKEAALQHVLQNIWQDSLGFMGLKMIRRIVGLAHVEDLESINDAEKRAVCEKAAIAAAREIVLARAEIPTAKHLVKRIEAHAG